MFLSKFAGLLSAMYADTMSVKHYAAVPNDDGTTTMKLVDDPAYMNVPCRISLSRADNAETTLEDKNPQYSQIKVFCDSSYAIRKGDQITAVKKQDDGTALATYIGTANLPFAFNTHKEIVLVDVRDA